MGVNNISKSASLTKLELNRRKSDKPVRGVTLKFQIELEAKTDYFVDK